MVVQVVKIHFPSKYYYDDDEPDDDNNSRGTDEDDDGEDNHEEANYERTPKYDASGNVDWRYYRDKYSKNNQGNNEHQKKKKKSANDDRQQQNNRHGNSQQNRYENESSQQPEKEQSNHSEDSQSKQQQKSQSNQGRSTPSTTSPMPGAPSSPSGATPTASAKNHNFNATWRKGVSGNGPSGLGSSTSAPSLDQSDDSTSTVAPTNLTSGEKGSNTSSATTNAEPTPAPYDGQQAGNPRSGGGDRGNSINSQTLDESGESSATQAPTGKHKKTAKKKASKSTDENEPKAAPYDWQKWVDQSGAAYDWHKYADKHYPSTTPTWGPTQKPTETEVPATSTSSSNRSLDDVSYVDVDVPCDRAFLLPAFHNYVDEQRAVHTVADEVDLEDVVDIAPHLYQEDEGQLTMYVEYNNVNDSADMVLVHGFDVFDTYREHYDFVPLSKLDNNTTVGRAIGAEGPKVLRSGCRIIRSLHATLTNPIHWAESKWMADHDEDMMVFQGMMAALTLNGTSDGMEESNTNAAMTPSKIISAFSDGNDTMTISPSPMPVLPSEVSPALSIVTITPADEETQAVSETGTPTEGANDVESWTAEPFIEVESKQSSKIPSKAPIVDSTATEITTGPPTTIPGINLAGSTTEPSPTERTPISTTGIPPSFGPTSSILRANNANYHLAGAPATSPTEREPPASSASPSVSPTAAPTNQPSMTSTQAPTTSPTEHISPAALPNPSVQIDSPTANQTVPPPNEPSLMITHGPTTASMAGVSPDTSPTPSARETSPPTPGATDLPTVVTAVADERTETMPPNAVHSPEV